MSWLLYGLVLSALLTAAAWGMERLLIALRMPTRWLWCGAMGATCAVVVLAWAGVMPSESETPAPAPPESPVAAVQSGFPMTGVTPMPDPTPSPITGTVGALASGTAAWLNRGISRMEKALTGPAHAGWVDRVASAALISWAAVSLLLLLTLVSTRAKLSRFIGEWPRAVLLGQAVRISGRMGPAVVGIRRPEIVLPAPMLQLPRSHLRLVLLHEREHVSAGDTRVLAGGLLPLLLFPWNPFLWIQNARLRESVEMDCDARVLSSGVPARRYAGILLDVGGDRFPGLSPAPALGRPGRRLERRIRSMKPRSAAIRLPAGLAGAALAAAFLVLACEVDTPTVDRDGVPEEAALDVRASPEASSAEADAPSWVVTGVNRGDAAPLIIVDGVIQETERVDVPPEHITGIEVLKGEAAREAYGERAGGGAVLLTTTGPDADPQPAGPDEARPPLELIEVPPAPELFETEGTDSFEVGRIERARTSVSVDGSEPLASVDGVTVRLRGSNMSVDGAEPLIIVDGIIRARGMEGIDPDDIVDIELVRGARASELYGSRASDGVINITTRGGGS